MTCWTGQTLAPSDRPLIASVGRVRGIPPRGNSLGSGSSAWRETRRAVPSNSGGTLRRLCLPGVNELAAGLPGERAGPGPVLGSGAWSGPVRGERAGPAIRRRGTAVRLRPAALSGRSAQPGYCVLIRLLRCGGRSGRSRSTLSASCPVLRIRLGWARFGRPVLRLGGPLRPRPLRCPVPSPSRPPGPSRPLTARPSSPPSPRPPVCLMPRRSPADGGYHEDRRAMPMFTMARAEMVRPRRHSGRAALHSALPPGLSITLDHVRGACRRRLHRDLDRFFVPRARVSLSDSRSRPGRCWHAHLQPYPTALPRCAD